ncbi:endoribonuclease LACTB2 [Rhodnius prolixus]|uniref:endoribonuclease LACTB2 n=1 Tax=Rhodnius prolixus TaxID=13249 RepID=UPI003D18A564
MSLKLEAVTKITPRIIRILGFNPGLMTLQGTNTYVIGNGQRRILLDTGEFNKPDYVCALKNVLSEERINLSDIIISHWHLDHIGGLRDVYNNFGKDSTVWKFRRTDERNPSFVDDVPIKYLKNGQEIQVDGATLKVIHTPGHTTDHIVLLLKEDNAIFTGDCILGAGTSVFEDLYDYMKSLEIILKLDPKILYPGHGPVVEDAKDRIEAYINHRKNREEQIVKILLKQKGQNVSTTNIVKSVYVDVPENLHKAAEQNVNNHLMKLRKDGRIAEISGGWALLHPEQD